jgi:3-hydroxymyristoyl/3-hydroxydecanoyl-(acyl carrier protein) dehydratase
LAHVNVKFTSSIRPPGDITLDAAVARRMHGLWLFDVTASCDGRRAAEGTLMLSVSAREKAR